MSGSIANPSAARAAGEDGAEQVRHPGRGEVRKRTMRAALATASWTFFPLVILLILTQSALPIMQRSFDEKS